jgi:hypothetical protein
MNTHGVEQRVAEQEVAVVSLLEHEANLQDQMTGLIKGDQLFAAGVIAFEQAELLAQLKEVPAARLAAEFAMMLAQKDLEISAHMLELIMEDEPFDPHLHITEAKYDLRQALAEYPQPGRLLVRGLALAYMGNAPVSAVRTTKYWSGMPENVPLSAPAIKRVFARRVFIDSSEGVFGLEIESTATHYKGLVGYARKPHFPPLEKIFLTSPDNPCPKMLGTNYATEPETREIAEALLALPDEPIYIER